MTDLLRQIPPELIQALVAALGAAAIAYLEKIRRDLAANTRATDAARSAAQQAERAAADVQQATVDRLEFDRLRRLEGALLTLPECDACRAKIAALTDRRRLRPRGSEES